MISGPWADERAVKDDLGPAIGNNVLHIQVI